MKERIAARLAELRAAEQEAIIRLTCIRTVIAELEALLAPNPIQIAGVSVEGGEDGGDDRGPGPAAPEQAEPRRTNGVAA